MKDKKISAVILAIVMIIIIGICAIAYNGTNIFKSEEQLFWKYAVKEDKIFELFNNDDMQDFRKNTLDNAYNTKVSASLNDGTNNYSINVDAKYKESNVFAYADIKNGDSDIVDCSVIKKDDIVGVKMDELANGYIAIKNSNLKDLAKKIGIDDIDDVPDNINIQSYFNLLEIDDNDKEYFVNKYSKLAISDTSNENYYTNKNVTIKVDDDEVETTEYKIVLTENEFKKIMYDVFYSLSSDSRALNIISSKLKLVNAPAEYTTVELLSAEIKEFADKINSSETTDDLYASVSLYVKNDSIVKTDINLKDERVISIINKEDEIKITQNRIDDSKSFKLILSVSDAIKSVMDSITEVDLKTKVNDDKNSLSVDFSVFTQDGTSLICLTTTDIVENMEEFTDYDNSKKIVLNDLDDEKLQSIYSEIKKLIPEIYNEKIKPIIGG